MKKAWINGKTILLTGVTSGFGKLLAKKLIENHDCKIIGIGRNKEKILSLQEELGEKSNKLEYHLFDVSEEQNWITLKQQLEEQKVTVDVLINNAGQLPSFKKFEKYSTDDFRNIMKVNFMASVCSINHLLPILKKSSTPAIINISSSASLCPLAGTSAYTASKSALKAFTECLIEDYRNDIYIAYVCPGFTKTDIFRNQTHEIDKIVDRFCSSCEQNTNRILKKIIKRKKRIIVGFDAKLMDSLYRHFPRTASHTCSSVMKKSKIKLFSDVFE